MNRSTKDELHISPREFSVLKDIVKHLPDISAKASLESATSSYEKVLGLRNIAVENDKVYFSALLRLSHYEGRTWREKLLRAAERIDKDIKIRQHSQAQRHRRAHSESSVSTPLPETSVRSVLQQKLDKQAQALSRTHPLRSQRKAHYSDNAPVRADPNQLSEEARYALVEKYKLFHRTQGVKKSCRYLDKWKRLAVAIRRRREEQWFMAIEEDHRTLKLQALEIWYRNYQSNIEYYEIQDRKADLFLLNKCYQHWENVVIKRRQDKYLARVAADLLKLSEVLLKKNNKRLQIRCLRHWKWRYQSIQRRMSKALILRNKNTQIVVWRMWFFKTCEIKTARCYELTLLQRTYRSWTLRLKKLEHLLEQADTKRTEDIMTRAFDNWRVEYATRESSMNYAIQYSEKKLLEQSMATWQFASSLARRQDDVQVVVEARMLSDALRVWHRKLQYHRANQDLSDLRRLKTLFNFWRMENKAAQIQTIQKEHQKRKFFTQWVVESRGKYVETQSEVNVLRLYMSRWSEKARLTIVKADASQEAWLQVWKKRASKVYLTRWVLSLERVWAREIEADRYYASTIASFAIARLKQVNEEWQFQTNRAHNFAQRTSNRAVFGKWYTTYLARKESQRENKLSLYLESKELVSIRRSLSSWRTRTQAYTSLAQIAAGRRDELEVARLRYFFSAWSDRHLDIFELERLARDFDSHRSAKFLWSTLLAKYRLRATFLAEADEIWMSKVQIEMRRRLRQWRQRHLRCLEKTRQADLWADVFEKRLQRQVFRDWSAKTKSRNAESQTFAGDTSSGSFDASRTRIRWSDASPTLRSNRSIFID